MDPFSLILTALATGAAAGVTAGAQETAGTAIKDLYNGLKTRLHQLFAATNISTEALQEYETDPDNWQGSLKKRLQQAAADQDAEILQMAQQLIEQAQATGRPVHSVQVTASGTRAVAIGGGVSGSTIQTGDSGGPPKPQT